MIPIMKYFLVLLIATLSAGLNIKMDNFEPCEKGEFPITFNMKIKNEGSKQVLEDGYIDSKIDLNNDVQNIITIYTYNDDKWNYVISKSDGTCTLVENFMGQFAKDLEKSVGLKSSCPYPKGKYELKNHPIDFSTFKYKEFPSGRVKVRSEFHPKDDEKKMLGCYEVELTLTE